MKLSTYINARRRNAITLAGDICAAPSLISQWASRKRPVPIERCIPIERATNGQVTRRDLRPHDWHLIWPELAEKHSAQPPPSSQESQGREAARD